MKRAEVGEDFASFREVARALVAQGIAPELVVLAPPELGQTSLIDEPFAAGEARAALSVPRRFLEEGEYVAAHRDPHRFNLLYCNAWLQAEIDAVKPDMVLCLGATAAQAFLGTGFKLTHSRGQVFETPFAPWWMATFHPSALLRAPDHGARERMKGEFLSDLKKAAKKLRNSQ